MDPFRGITIDPEGAADLDDAINVARDGDGWLVQVAIPDCRELVPAGSDLDLAARRMGQTAYAATGVRRHMLSEDAAIALSLMPGTDKAVLLITIALDADLTPSTPVIVPGTFRSAGRLTYVQANQALRDPSHRNHETLVLADRLAGALSARRARSGAVGLRDLGKGLLTDEEGRVGAGAAYGAYRIVHELMVLANTSVAALCAGEGLRILFRNHRALPTASRESLLESILLAQRGLAPADTLAERLNLVVGRARLGSAVEGHWGLNLPAYAWFTSPIRRYADLVNQRILSAWARGEAHPVDDLDALASHLNDLQDAAKAATSGWHKAQAAKEAEARIEAGAVTQAGATAFTGMVKASREAARIPDAIVEEALARLARGALTSKDIARLLSASPEVAARMVTAMASRTQEAVAAANFIAQSSGTALPTYEEASQGPSHAPTFTVTAAFAVDGTRHVSPPVTGPSLKETRQRAVLHVLALAYGAPAPSWPDAAPARQAPAPVPAKAAPATNPKNAVLELCQARKWPPPRFEVTQEGPSHKPTFTARAILDLPGRTVASRAATAASRKAAEISACSDLLGEIGKMRK